MSGWRSAATQRHATTDHHTDRIETTMTVQRRRIALLAFTGVLALALTACGSGSSGGQPTGSNPTAGTHNAADVTFAQGMIPHHAQAVTMATQALQTSSNPKVIDLAQRIKSAQDPEITLMSGWLRQWGEDVPDTSMSGTGMSGDMDHSMSGMMTDQQMSALANARDAKFDRLFLTLMIAHHNGAIEMATTEQQRGSYPAAVDLAGRIITAQQGEISEMRQLLT